eukprot:6324771-Prorocentrum_lima.AAC.1
MGALSGRALRGGGRAAAGAHMAAASLQGAGAHPGGKAGVMSVVAGVGAPCDVISAVVGAAG